MNELPAHAQAPAWLPEALTGAWNVLATYPIVLALVVFVVGLGLAVIGRSFVLHWGGKLTARTRNGHDEKLLRIMANLTALIVGYVSLVAAVQVLGLNERVEQIIIRVLMSILILRMMVSAMRAAHVGLAILGQLRDRFRIVEERTLPLFDLVATIGIVGAAAYALLMVWKIDPTAWLASAGVVGIAVGFAARDTLANLFAGFFIIADAPYKLGDYIVLDSGDRGEITKVGIRSTRMLTRDDVEITVPNSAMANAKVYNESGGKWVRFRIRLKVGVAYGSDVDEVVELLEGVAREHDNVCKDPDPRVRMRGFGDSSLDFELLCWVNHPSERGLVTHELYMDIYKALGRAGIEIPFPQRDVWMREAPQSASERGAD
ncbi:mechanosensitive ion channel family protein [Wenzhouxiangella marina]|uniref:Small-conductance mechanosensitive channel n=1 Tax=Wenzhouxiangella marina TaxID=1579979 RepID=A0A0K0XT40_9GAMM|nr:mechanosensitive ion channel family protein [Wenzhouxiangella marina]AKS40825.1 MscS Mechanosensitive ion channel [Wenzhouxiangella marina]MBB6087699.1 small-conductance mechanosensitive channel [Wenzhouxiangella marina]